LAHFCERHGTPIALARLNYAVEMRYGVLVDIGRAVQSGQPVDVTMGHVNVVWQGYANTVILRLLRHAATPPFVQHRRSRNRLGTARGRNLRAAVRPRGARG